MTNYFALFDEPRRPWLDPDALKTHFLALSIAWHPDRFHHAAAADRRAAQDRFAELNAAYHCLRDPKERLRHLLELECGARPREIQDIPAGSMDLFAQVGQACRDASAFLAEKSRTTSPMVRAQHFTLALDWTDTLQKLQQRLDVGRAALLTELKAMNSPWDAAPPVGSPTRRPALPLERVEEIYRTLSFLNRWMAQIQERLVQLSLC